MLTMVIRSHPPQARGSATLRAALVCVSLLAVGTVRAQDTNRAANVATNDPYAITSLTLTGNVFATPLVSISQALAELKQRLQLSLAAKDYANALNYANLGLRVDPSDTQFLTAKAIALVGLHQHSAAAQALKDILAVQPDDTNAVCSLAELLLIDNQVGEYRSFAAGRKTQIELAYDGQLVKYFSVLEGYQTADQEKFREVVIKALATLPSGSGPFLRGWEFNELLSAISKQPNSPKKAMLLTFIRVLSGDIERDTALRTIKGL